MKHPKYFQSSGVGLTVYFWMWYFAHCIVLTVNGMSFVRVWLSRFTWSIWSYKFWFWKFTFKVLKIYVVHLSATNMSSRLKQALLWVKKILWCTSKWTNEPLWTVLQLGCNWVRRMRQSLTIMNRAYCGLGVGWPLWLIQKYSFVTNSWSNKSVSSMPRASFH